MGSALQESYTDEQRKEAAVQYAISGSLKHVARLTSIPETTLGYWKRNWDGWDEIIADIRAENHDRFVATAQELIDAATTQALEKLPEASAKDAAMIGAIYRDKLTQALNIRPPEAAEKGVEAFNRLANEFRNLAQSFQEKQVKDTKAIDGELAE